MNLAENSGQILESSQPLQIESQDEELVEDIDDKEVEEESDDEEEEQIKYPQMLESIKGNKSQSGQSLQTVSELDNDSAENKLKQMATNSSVWPFFGPSLASLSDTNVVIESLQNTTVAVAQHPPSSPELLPQPPPQNALQSTLFNLQQQQMMLLHVIHQLQTQISGNGANPQFPVPLLVPPLQPNTSPDISPSDTDKSPLVASQTPSNTPSFTHSSTSKPITPAIETPPLSTTIKSPTLTSVPIVSKSANITEPSNQPMLSPLKERCSPITDSSGTQLTSEPNTLELLQRHTEQALQNTMSGGSFLLNGIAGMGSSDFLSFRKTKDGKEDPMYRHRCKFCGKVFGSDSALQIHIRSHTGERPFKCNICGNRFTTKGNLKVHFQRHKAKYPHIKMNPHPVPEHLDKFHPPIEPPTGSQSPTNLTPISTPPISMSGMAPILPQSISSLTRTLLESTAMPQTKDMKGILSTNFGKHMLDYNTTGMRSPDQPLALSMQNNSSNDISNQSPLSDESELDCDENENIDDKDLDDDSEDERAINLEKRARIEQSADSPLNLQNIRKEEAQDLDEVKDDEDMSVDDFDKECADETIKKDILNKNKEPMDSDDDISEDDSSDGLNMNTGVEFPYMPHFPPYFHSGAFPGIPTSLGFMPFGLPPSLPPIPTSGPPTTEASSGENRDPVFYQDLLPKPGSTDNTWETLMEVQKASETVKLQQLVDNIEHKLTDPNQCIICHRVLSCKSALQMHYRTHTGERPFKCKICGRAFTTKGNLKTHMGVHRVKPPLRILHQCPVCHKQFTNALVIVIFIFLSFASIIISFIRNKHFFLFSIHFQYKILNGIK